jgi:hypothetical protein
MQEENRASEMQCLENENAWRGRSLIVVSLEGDEYLGRA